MKKRIIILLILALFTTGCTCEYNLKIENGEYQETVTLIGENNQEINLLDDKYSIPVDKEIYNHPGDPDTVPQTDGENYKYNFSGNKLTFTYDFNDNSYQNSSAVSNCYNTLTVGYHNDSTIISTSSNAICFSRYPTLNNIQVNVTIDGEVSSHNADSVNGNIYTWNLTRENADSKSINLIFKEKATGKEGANNPISEVKKTKKDYSMYILGGILLVLFLIGYRIYIKIKSDENNLDD